MFDETCDSYTESSLRNLDKCVIVEVVCFQSKITNRSIIHKKLSIMNLFTVRFLLVTLADSTDLLSPESIGSKS